MCGPRLSRRQRAGQLSEVCCNGRIKAGGSRTDQVAGAYLALMANPYITGQRLVVDGGGSLV